MTSEMEESKRLMEDLHEIFIKHEDDEGYRIANFCLAGQSTLSEFVAHCIFNSYEECVHEEIINTFGNTVREDIKRYLEEEAEEKNESNKV